MVKKTVLIIGGNGFIGSNLCRYLSKKNFNVIATYRKKKFFIKDVKFLKLDLGNPINIKKQLGNLRFKYVINCSGYINHENILGDGKSVLYNHFINLLNLVDSIKKKNLTKFINLGSSDEYGSQKSPQKEKIRENPKTIYSLAKTSSAHFLQMLNESIKLPTLTLRLFLVYGPGQSKDRLIPYIIKNALSNKKFMIFGGNQVKDFCYIDDVCRAIFLSLNNKKSDGKILNIGSGKKIKITALVDKILKITKKGYPQYLDKRYRKSENIKQWANINEAKKVLNWKPLIKIEDGINKILKKNENTN